MYCSALLEHENVFLFHWDIVQAKVIAENSIISCLFRVNMPTIYQEDYKAINLDGIVR